MEKILDSISLGFLIRSVFSGAFFVLTFYLADPGFFELDSEKVFSVGLALSLFAGVTVYGLHRSLVYPLIESIFNKPCAFRSRENGSGLISDASISHLAKIWDSKSKDGSDLQFQRGKQIETWADFTHLQYVSAWCIIFGTIVGIFANLSHKGCHDIHLVGLFFLFILGVPVFFAAALVSNWRLFSIVQRMDRLAPIPPPK